MTGDVISSYKFIKSGAKISYKLVNMARHHVQKRRFVDFVDTVDTRLESMSEEELETLNELWKSNIGQEMINDFSESVLQCSSERIRTALALQFCKDKEPELSTPELKTFLMAAKELDDYLVDFFLFVSSKNVQQVSNTPPYSLKKITGDGSESMSLPYTGEEIFININILIKMRFIAPDTTTRYEPDNGWQIYFGVTSVTTKFRILLEKSKYLLDAKPK